MVLPFTWNGHSLFIIALKKPATCENSTLSYLWSCKRSLPLNDLVSLDHGHHRWEGSQRKWHMSWIVSIVWSLPDYLRFFLNWMRISTQHSKTIFCLLFYFSSHLCNRWSWWLGLPLVTKLVAGWQLINYLSFHLYFEGQLTYVHSIDCFQYLDLYKYMLGESSWFWDLMCMAWNHTPGSSLLVSINRLSFTEK